MKSAAFALYSFDVKKEDQVYIFIYTAEDIIIYTADGLYMPNE